jgi:Ca2+-binding EF-hand superfamily protein
MSYFNITLTVDEQDIFFLYIDIDGKNYIKYEEFVRMLRRSGLTSVSSENKIVMRIYEAI